MRTYFFEGVLATFAAVLLSAVAAGGAYGFYLALVPATKAVAAQIGGDTRALQLVDFSVTCATSATQVVPSGSAGIEDAFIFNNSATPIYVGGSSVGTSTGIPVCTDTASCVQSSIALNVVRGGVYCKTSSGTVSVRVLSGAYAL